MERALWKLGAGIVLVLVILALVLILAGPEHYKWAAPIAVLTICGMIINYYKRQKHIRGGGLFSNRKGCNVTTTTFDNINKDWCDGNDLSKKKRIEFHPDNNQACTDVANTLTQDSVSWCGNQHNQSISFTRTNDYYDPYREARETEQRARKQQYDEQKKRDRETAKKEADLHAQSQFGDPTVEDFIDVLGDLASGAGTILSIVGFGLFALGAFAFESVSIGIGAVASEIHEYAETFLD